MGTHEKHRILFRDYWYDLQKKLGSGNFVESTSIIYNYSITKLPPYSMFDENSIRSFTPYYSSVNENEKELSSDKKINSSKRRIFDFSTHQGAMRTRSLPSLQSEPLKRSVQNLNKVPSTSALLHKKGRNHGDRSVSFNPKIYVYELQDSTNEVESSEWQRYFSDGS